MTNAPQSRKTHVIRLAGTNKNGEILKDIWVDVERIDEFTVNTQTTKLPNQWQEITVILKWKDDPNIEGYEPEDDEATITSRVHKLLKIIPGGGYADKPEKWVPVKVINRVDFTDSGKDRHKRFVNQAVQAEVRKVSVRRIHHYDTNIDAAAKAVFEGGKKAYVVPGRDYERTGDRDADRFVEHEILLRLERTDSKYEKSIGRDQALQFRLKNQYLIDESEPAQLLVVGPDGINPPYRLDPFQNIINVSGQPKGPSEFWAQVNDFAGYSSLPVIDPPPGAYYTWKSYGNFAFASAMYAGAPGPYANYSDYVYCYATDMTIPANPLYAPTHALAIDHGNWILAGSPGGFAPGGYITFTISGPPYGPAP